MTISEIYHHVHFNVLVPKNVPDDWTLEIKTYPWEAKSNFTSFRLHYVDKNDEKLMVSIEQMKGSLKQTEENNPNANDCWGNGEIKGISSW